MNNNALAYNQIQTFQRCPKAFEYKVIEKIQRKRRDKALTKGTMIHRLLFAGYQPPFFKNGAVMQEFLAMDAELSQSEVLFTDEVIDARMLLDEALAIVEGYFMYWGDEPVEVLHAEEEFYMQLPGGLVISFTPDLVLRFPDGHIEIWDHKSTASVPSELPIMAELQPMIYYAGVQALYGDDLTGFTYNWLRKKVPTYPRLNKTIDKATGLYRVNNLNAIDTTYEILRDFLVDYPELQADEDHRRRLAELRDENRFYFRRTLRFNQEQIENGLMDIQSSAQLIADAQRFPRFVQNTGVSACDRCEFNAVCQAELLGWDAQAVRDTQYEPREPKNEYESEDD